MVGADDSETAKRAVEVATDIAAMYGAKLHIVTAFEKGVAQGRRRTGVHARPHRGRRSGTPADTLLHREEAERRGETALGEGRRRARHSWRRPRSWAPTSSSWVTAGCADCTECSAACPTPCRTARTAPCSSSTPSTTEELTDQAIATSSLSSTISSLLRGTGQIRNGGGRQHQRRRRHERDVESVGQRPVGGVDDLS
jgi:hypothetical protein